MGMDLQSGLASKQDLEYLQTQMKNVYAVQTEHSDRLMRLEQRQDADPRLKSPWGGQSPFPGLLNGTPQQDSNLNPAGEAFKQFDQDQASSMVGSLNLEAEDEPRRATSRANGVRFDESAKYGHGHAGQGSRVANDFYPSRSGSAFGSHPLTERSASHKSEGRQSSTHSARLSSIGIESRPLSATVPSFVPSNQLAPPPGLFILGPVPAIIRCWLDTNFSNDTLRYAAVCTGSYKSLIRTSLVDRLGCKSRITVNKEQQLVIKLPVYLPEATIQQSSSRPGSPAPHLPTLTTEFVLEDRSSSPHELEIFLGCDVLRFRNADIHFSLDRLTLFDDERNKVSVPLVRPENAATFQYLQINSIAPVSDSAEELLEPHVPAEPHLSARETTDIRQTLPTEGEGVKTATSEEQSPAKQASMPPSPSPATIGEIKKALQESNKMDNPATARPADSEAPTNGTTPDTPNKPEGSSIWGSWRRDSVLGSRPEVTNTSSHPTSGYQRAGRGRGMKVLKPARLNASRTSSSQQPVGFDAAPSRFGEGAKSASLRDDTQSPATATDRRTFSNEVKQPLSGKPNSSNPVGGASAFGWLSSGSKSYAPNES